MFTVLIAGTIGCGLGPGISYVLCIQLSQFNAESKNGVCTGVCMCVRSCECSNALGVSGVGEASIVKQITQRKRQCVLSDTLQWLSLRGRVWHSLNTLCLGRGGVSKHIMDKRDGVRVAKCITESERLRECNISKHIMLEQRWHA